MPARALFAVRGRCLTCGCVVTVVTYNSPVRALLRLDARTCPNCGEPLAQQALSDTFVRRCLHLRDHTELYSLRSRMQSEVRARQALHDLDDDEGDDGGEA